MTAERLVVQDEKRTAVWDVRDRRHPEAIWSTTPIEDEQTGATALSRDDKIMAGVERHGSLSIWTMTSRTRPRKVATVRGIGQVADIAFSPGADVMAVARVREGIRLYDVSHPTRPRRIADLAEPAEFVSTITFDPTGTRLAIGGSGGAVSLWDVRTPEYAVLVRTLRGVGGAVRDADFSPDGSRVLTVGDGVAHTAMLWRLNPFQAQRRAVLTGRGTYDYSPEVALSPDDDVAVVRSDGKLSSWNLRDVSRPRPIGKTGVVARRLGSVAAAAEIGPADRPRRWVALRHHRRPRTPADPRQGRRTPVGARPGQPARPGRGVRQPLLPDRRPGQGSDLPGRC
nr:hypothetical protein GCM10020092_075290 [Actinoplanes digitatis]